MRAAWMLVLLLSTWSCSTVEVLVSAPEVIDPFQEPNQQRFSARQSFRISNDHGDFVLFPRAAYRIAALIVSCKRYRNGWEASLSPMDLGIVWGEMSRGDVVDSLRFTHKERGYRYALANLSGFDGAYADEHIANVHVMPASKAIRRALGKLRSKDRVLLSGFLVDVYGKGTDREYIWKSSLSRSDRGEGACLLLYLQKMQINGTVFE